MAADLTENQQKPPIGRPIANTQIYILDPHLQLVPIGVPGELYVGGVGVARGYLNRPDLTKEKFILNPFSDKPGDRLYKTGDLARYLSDGNIEYLGRIDYQVKIRGFRIELGEIEGVLSCHPQVREVAVLVREETPNDKRLVAYVVPTDTPLSVNELRLFLKTKLPDYMMPAAFVILEAMPLTPNGKVDRRALQLLDSQVDTSAVFMTPSTPTEEVLVAIWAEVLRLERVGIGDNFFELGGNSLLAIQVIFRVREVFGVDLPVRCLFESPSVAQMAHAIDSLRQGVEIVTNTVLDLNAEAVLDSTIRPNLGSDKVAIATGSIFLTGATGFLGVYLLQELLERTTADIYCLVRAANPEEGKKRLQSQLESYFLWNEKFTKRLVPVVGDLSQPLLGLPEQQFVYLANQIDIIYHNGALVNFVYPYYALKASNVLGTQEVLRLATHTKVKPVHYISTFSVFDSWRYFNGRLIREDEELDCSEILFFGYAQSKWVAEKLVAIARDRGVPVSIYRPGIIVGHSKTGVWNSGDLMFKTIEGCIQLGKYPDFDMLLHLTPIDYVSQAIVHLSQKPESLGKIFHLVSPHDVHFRQLFEWLGSFGYPIQQISYEDWKAELIENFKHSQDNALFSVLPFFTESLSGEKYLTFPEIYVRGKQPQYDCQNTLDGLADTSIVCPTVDDKLMKNYLAYFIRSGLLNAPKNRES